MPVQPSSASSPAPRANHLIAPPDAASWQRFEAARQAFRGWFVAQAMPLWTTAGVDLAQGGFAEKLDAQGRPLDEPRRTRVVARQLYVWSVAEPLGWPHDTSGVVAHGLDFLLHRLLQADGTFASSVTPQGQVVNATFDLYEQAFALFAMATVYRRKPQAHADLLDVSTRLLTVLRQGWGHPVAGFEESRPRTLPLRANPHMHLFEATLQWAEALRDSQAPNVVQAPWWALADELAGLALQHMVQASSGLLTELFDGDWRPMPGDDGRLVEPGHQFEWGWLLIRWGLLRERPDALAAAQHMVALAEAKGVDAQRGVAINAMDTDGAWRDAHAKLWPQTERIKAWATMASLGSDTSAVSRSLDHCSAAMSGLMGYLARPLPGAWYESLDAQGGWSPEPVRASSLYHIVCALETACALSLTPA